MVPYNDVGALETAFKRDPHIVGVCYEPIQGEAGIIVPDADFFPRVKELCKKHNALLCCDEIQTGLCRTGKMLCSEHYGTSCSSCSCTYKYIAFIDDVVLLVI